MTDDGQGGIGETQLLLGRVLDGDGDARGALLDRMRPRLVLWVVTRLSDDLRSRVEPEDVAQEVLLAVHRDLDRFRNRGMQAFYAWFFRIAENRIRDLVDYYGAKKRQVDLPRAVSQTTPATAAVKSEQLMRVRVALSRLPEDHRRVIQLRRLEERDVPEVAASMGRSENAIRVLYCRALKTLREEMDARGDA